MIVPFAPLSVAVKPVLGYLHSSINDHGPQGGRLAPALPFVTISRQAGVNGAALARRLAEQLNREIPATERRWSVFDHELVDRVAADHHIAQELVNMLEHANRTWIEEFFAGMSLADRHQPGEMKVFRSLVSTVRALAQAGLVVLVGRGGVMITRDMAAGLHVRVVALLEKRIEAMMQLHHEPRTQAAQRVRQLDEERTAFFQRHWPDRPLRPETFDITLNAALGEEPMADCLAGLVKARTLAPKN